MNLIQLKLPADATLQFNSLYDRLSRRVLVEDILLVTLPEGVEIDVGWYPSRDLNGSFLIRVYQGDLDSPLEEPISGKNPKWVAEEVKRLAHRYSTQGTRVDSLPFSGYYKIAESVSDAATGITNRLGIEPQYA